MTRQKIMGLHYDSWTREETLKAICDSIKCGAKHVYRSDINAASFLMSEKNPQIKKYVNDAPIINLDGMGVVFGCKILGKSAVERIAGADLFVDLLKVSNDPFAQKFDFSSVLHEEEGVNTHQQKFNHPFDDNAFEHDVLKEARSAIKNPEHPIRITRDIKKYVI